jgi:hypothetical protein
MEIVSNNLKPLRRNTNKISLQVEQDPFSVELKLNNERAIRALEKARLIAQRNERMAEDLKARSEFFFSNSEKFLLQ